MVIHHIKGAVGVVIGLSLAAVPAFAQGGGAGAGVPPQGGQQRGQAGLGAAGGAQGAAGGVGAGGYGAYAGVAAPVVAPIPQYWIADATLFIGNAANAASVLSAEENLNVQASPVLGNQASFLLAATNRALTSLLQLQQNAQATDPTAIPAIRTVVGNLVAAKATASQAAEEVNAGLLGPTFTTNIRTALAHLAAAERGMVAVGRAYGVQQFATAGVCSASRGAAAFGAGLGGTRGTGRGGVGGTGGTTGGPGGTGTGAGGTGGTQPPK